jgi:hypothetical protein
MDPPKKGSMGHRPQFKLSVGQHLGFEPVEAGETYSVRLAMPVPGGACNTLTPSTDSQHDRYLSLSGDVRKQPSVHRNLSIFSISNSIVLSTALPAKYASTVKMQTSNRL